MMACFGSLFRDVHRPSLGALRYTQPAAESCESRACSAGGCIDSKLSSQPSPTDTSILSRPPVPSPNGIAAVRQSQTRQPHSDTQDMDCDMQRELEWQEQGSTGPSSPQRHLGPEKVLSLHDMGSILPELETVTDNLKEVIASSTTPSPPPAASHDNTNTRRAYTAAPVTDAFTNDLQPHHHQLTRTGSQHAPIQRTASPPIIGVCSPPTDPGVGNICRAATGPTGPGTTPGRPAAHAHGPSRLGAAQLQTGS